MIVNLYKDISNSFLPNLLLSKIKFMEIMGFEPLPQACNVGTQLLTTILATLVADITILIISDIY